MMKFDSRIPIAAIAATVLVCLAITNRYEIYPQQTVIIRFDRWTGRLEGCTGNGCTSLESAK